MKDKEFLDTELEEFFNINDTYKIKQSIIDLKKLILDLELDVNDFLGHKKTKYKGVRARKKLGIIRNEFIPKLQKNILKTKQDYDSDYS